MKKILLSFVGMAAFVSVSHAQNVPLTYKNPNGSSGNVTMISGVNPDGTPLVSTYTAADGKQRIPLVAENICSVVNGVPQVCANGGGSADSPGFVVNRDNTVTSVVSLPTSDPVNKGEAWNDNGVLMQSTGSASKPDFDGSNLSVTSTVNSNSLTAPLNLFIQDIYENVQQNRNAIADYAPLAGATFTGAVSAPSLNVTNTVHAGYLTADALASATAFQTGYNGWYQVTSQNGSGTVKFMADNDSNGLVSTASGGATGIAFKAFTYATLPTSEVSDGVIIACSDCTYNGVTGVQLRWSASASAWYTMDNVKVTSTTTAASFSTPITGTDATFTGNVLAGKSLQIQVPNSTVTGGIKPIGTLGLELINSNSAIMDLQAGSIYSSWLIVPKTFTYASLPSSPPTGGNSWCSDCWSSSNSNGSSSKGIPVWWSGSAWVDAIGQSVNHS